jgi:hypothetical protein
LDFFWKYPKETQTHDFSGMDINDVPKGVYVLINHYRVDFLNSAYGYVLPRFYNRVPNQWVLKWANYDAELYWAP